MQIKITRVHFKAGLCYIRKICLIIGKDPEMFVFSRCSVENYTTNGKHVNLIVKYIIRILRIRGEFVLSDYYTYIIGNSLYCLKDEFRNSPKAMKR